MHYKKKLFFAHDKVKSKGNIGVNYVIIKIIGNIPNIHVSTTTYVMNYIIVDIYKYFGDISFRFSI